MDLERVYHLHNILIVLFSLKLISLERVYYWHNLLATDLTLTLVTTITKNSDQYK